MKRQYFLIAFFVGFICNVFAQTSSDITTINKRSGEYIEKCFKIEGEKSKLFVDNMFSNYQKVKRNGYIHKFRSVSVDGIDGLLDIKIQEGVAGRNENYEYFNTFVSENYRKERIVKMTENEVFGVYIYVQKSRKDYLTSREEAAVFVEFLKRVIAPS